jgi:hypothetical protein
MESRELVWVRVVKGIASARSIGTLSGNLFLAPILGNECVVAAPLSITMPRYV